MKRAGDDKRLSKVVSTKLTDKDYELCQRIARDYYIKGNIIGTPSVSELARLALEPEITTTISCTTAQSSAFQSC